MEDNVKLVENLQKINLTLDNSISFLEKGYLTNRQNYEILEADIENQEIDYRSNIRIIHLKKFVYEKEENIIDKLSNIYTALYGNKSSIFFVIDSNGKECNFYLGVKDKKDVSQALLTLSNSLNGNFSGIQFSILENENNEELMGKILEDDVFEISTVIGVPALKQENKEKFLQGIEKLINGMEGKEFSAIFIADPIEYSKLKETKRAFEELYNQLVPFSQPVISLNETKTVAFMEGTSESFSESYSQTLSKTESTSKTYSTGHSKSEGANAGVYAGVQVGISQILGVMFGNSVGINSSVGENFGESDSKSYSETSGGTNGKNKAKSKSKSKTKSKSKGITYQFNPKNKIIENILSKIELHLKRISLGEGNGWWHTGIYFISKEPQNSITAANIYNGLVRGKESCVEKNGVYTFDKKNKLDLEKLKDYLYNFSNPRINVKSEYINIDTQIGSLITNEELAFEMNLPKKTVYGLDVLEMATFGKNFFKTEKSTINIGNVYNLGKKSNIEAKLNVESLALHTFITGSTGAGKTNAVCTILKELYNKKIKFMIIEPAKGEYKNIFGGLDDVKVYGTNYKFTELLKINPFSFNEEIHILEHIDRLTEIFNACWPMYAAMPSILKNAIEIAYKKLGWDLEKSENIFGKKVFPTFRDLEKSLETVIKNSSYSSETKGDYIGALVTRVSSLKNGLYRNIFSVEELNEKELFEENVIIDLSRIPSIETKSLIMGIVFMKLHEYKMSKGIDENAKLNHVTVMEEAHNILRKTSYEQSQENSNLQGKSLEMITNSIAEMRAYGEGFMIIDQSPTLLDEAVIKNTNTKICLRIPSKKDREIVGSSMNLTEIQINELARLETGVAAVMQNDWNESVLVKFNYMAEKNKYIYEVKENKNKINQDIIRYLLESKLPENEKLHDKLLIEKIKDILKGKEIDWENLENDEKDKIIFELIEGEKILEILEGMDFNNWYSNIEKILKNFLNEQEMNYYKIEIINSIVRTETLRNSKYRPIYEEWNELIRQKKGVF